MVLFHTPVAGRAAAVSSPEWLELGEAMGPDRRRDGQPDRPGRPSRRAFLSANAMLLAAVGLRDLLPAPAQASTAAATPASAHLAGVNLDAAPKGITNLALYRPVTVSSTDYAPTPAEFAVDRLADTGVRGSGWRAGGADPQWIAVDLQAPCQVQSVVLVFEADLSDPAFTPASGTNPYADTMGTEILSSCPTAFEIDVSADGQTWTSVYQTTSGAGGTMTIDLPAPVSAQWVRLTATQQANANPLGLNSFQVYGTSSQARPKATGWTNWPARSDTTPPPLTVAADGTVPIESGWDLTLDDWAASSSGQDLSGPSVDTSTWLQATVPGTVLTTLVDRGHLPDPTLGFGNLSIPEALSRHSWWYRRSFELPAAFTIILGGHVWLEFDGINHQAQVWLNGTQVGELTYPVARAAFDITQALAASGEQVLAVEISPMPHPGTPGDKGPDGISFLYSDEVSLDSPTYLSVSGWDWMPAVRDRVSGIWNHVRLRATADAVLGDPRVDTLLPNLPDTSVAEVTVVVPVQNAGSQDAAVTVTAAFGEVSVSTTVTVPAGQSVEVAFSPNEFPALVVANPKLWWPNGYGEASLYDLVMTATIGGVVSDRRTRQFGLRQLDYKYSLPVQIDSATDRGTQTGNFATQTARYLRIQCYTRATQWGDSMWTLSVFDTSSPGTDLALGSTATASSVDSTSHAAQNAVDGNPNTRWSSAYEDNQWIQLDLGSAVTFNQVQIVWEQAYALTYAIQVSNDAGTWTTVLNVSNTTMPLQISVNGVPVLCRGGNWGWDELLRRMLPNRVNDVMALHRDMNFTMVRNWSGNSNREEFFAACDANGILVWNEFWQSDGLFPPSQSYDAFLTVAQDTITRYRIHPCIVVWCAANETTPPPTIDTGLNQAVASLAPGLLYQSNSAAGVVSGGGPYSWVDPADYFSGSLYVSGSFGFHTEIGIPVIPVTDTMLNLIGDTPDPQYDLPIVVPSSTDQAPPQIITFPLQQARYLKIQCYQRATQYGDSIWTLSVFGSSAPGTDLAQGKTATASSVDDASRPPSNAVDGNPNTRWSSAYEDNQWIEVDLGSVVSFDQVLIVWEAAFALNYAIEVSVDGVSWATVQQVYNGGPWYLHDWCWQGDSHPDTYQTAIDALLGVSQTLDEFCIKAQFVNYENMRAIFEAWNANLWDNGTGIMLWMSNPAWHSIVWQTYDYDLDVNGSYFGARKGCEPVHVQASPVNGQVLVANHTAAALTGVTVTATLYDLSGSTQLGSPQSQTVSVGASSTTAAFTVPFASSLPSPHLLVLGLNEASGAGLAQNLYWRYRAATDMQALNQLAQAQVSASAGPVTVSGGSHHFVVSLSNTGATVAAMLSFSLRDQRSGQRILPAFYSDGYLWLLPGESRAIEVSWPHRAATKSAVPQLVIRGYNLPELTVAIA
jgi:Exo-beta-D-glucosaminidase Ig-fold domain/F5/8 type C domain/Glycosyl hydrolases family 2